MEHSDLSEILSRIEGLERAVDLMHQQLHQTRDGHDRDRYRDERNGGDGGGDRDRGRDGGNGRDRGGGLPDEKRIVDMIVRLVAEHVDEIVVHRLAQLEESLIAPKVEQPEQPEPPPAEGDAAPATG